MVSGPKIFRGGWSKVTRQYDDVRRARWICLALVTLLMFVSEIGTTAVRLIRWDGIWSPPLRRMDMNDVHSSEHLKERTRFVDDHRVDKPRLKRQSVECVVHAPIGRQV